MKKIITESELVNLITLMVEEVNSQPKKILDVPHYLQSDDSTCGPASLRMVFGYYGKFMSENDIAEICNHTYELGCKSEDMACAAESLGFDVYLKNNSTIEEVIRLIDANVPVIVDWFCGDPPEGHSSVVIGYNDDNLFILDPYLEEMRVVSKYDFRRCWFDFYETPITPQNLYVGQIIVIKPKSGQSVMKEYFDPIRFIKNKLKDEPRYVKDPSWIPYEEQFQKLVDFVFKKTKKYNDVKHLNGYKVNKVTPQSDKWIVVMTPIVDDWFNWVKNKSFQEELEKFHQEFNNFVRMGGIDSPHQHGGYPRDMQFILSRA